MADVLDFMVCPVLVVYLVRPDALVRSRIFMPVLLSVQTVFPSVLVLHDISACAAMSKQNITKIAKTNFFKRNPFALMLNHLSQFARKVLLFQISISKMIVSLMEAILGFVLYANTVIQGTRKVNYERYFKYI